MKLEWKVTQNIYKKAQKRQHYKNIPEKERKNYWEGNTLIWKERREDKGEGRRGITNDPNFKRVGIIK